MAAKTELFGVKPGALAAWRELLQALDAISDPPCTGEPGLWFSDDPGERDLAARACRPCPAMRHCAAFADANGETAGVWGSRDRTPAPGRPPGGGAGTDSRTEPATPHSERFFGPISDVALQGGTP